MLQALAACITGFIIDLILGDPYWFKWHPIRLIGNLITFMEIITRKIFSKNKNGELAAGAVTAVVVTAVSVTIPFIIIRLCDYVSPYLSFVVQSIMCYFIFALKSLKTESMKVYYALENDGIEAGRHAVSMIVGRDTECLDEKGVIKAAVETVAENSSDGIIAPLIFMMLFGACGGFFYKAVNTMDSMIGYKNDKYLYFGRVAAKADDIVNFIPARISAMFIIMAAFILPDFDGKESYRIFKRDRMKSSSPNSAQTEAACAGAMNIQLLGDAYYFGKLYKKQTIGEPVREIERKDIIRVNRLLYVMVFLAMIIFSTIKLLVVI